MRIVKDVFLSCTLWVPEFTIKNENGDSVLLIKGPCCTCQFCADIEFQVRSIGEI